MKCHNCGTDNPAGNSFCMSCGSPLEAGSNADASQAEGIAGAESRRVASFAEVEARLAALEQTVRAMRSTLEARGAVPSASGGRATFSKQLSGLRPSSSPETFESGATTPPTGGTASVAAPRTRDWEFIFGGNWMARIGAVALVFGVGFFLKLAFDNDWIGETGRVVLGLVAGIVLIGAGEFWQSRYGAWAQAVTGGGIAILYLAIFAAFSFYGLIPGTTAFASLAMVTLVSGALALRYESMTIAILGMLGGFFTPLMLSEGLPDERLLLAFILLLDVGVLGLSSFRNWRWFVLLALTGSLANFALYHAKFDATDDLLLSEIAITAIFVTFLAATSVFHILWRQRPGWPNYALVIANAAAYLGISYWLLWDELRPWMGGLTVLLALVYTGLGYIAMSRIGRHLNLSFVVLVVGLVMLTIAVPVQFDGPWTPIAWAVEAAALMWLSFRLEIWQLRMFAIVVYAALAIDLLFVETLEEMDGFNILLNGRMLGFAAGIIAFYIAAAVLKKNRSRTGSRDVEFRSGFLIAANLLTLWVASAEVIAAVDSGAIHVDRGDAAFNVKSLGLSLLWTLYAGLVLVAGLIWRWHRVRVAALALLAVPVFKLFLVDSFALEAGYRVAAFLVLGAILVAGGFLYQRFRVTILGFLFEDQMQSPNS